MLSVRGYLKNNRFIPTENISLPEGKEVIVTFLDDIPDIKTADTKSPQQVFKEFFAALKEDTEELPPLFDEIIEEGIKFKEYDWS